VFKEEPFANCWKQKMLIDVKKKRNEQTEQAELLMGVHAWPTDTNSHGELRSLGKAETAETETARYPRVQKIQHESPISHTKLCF
jgi:hypothetical protein